MIADDIVSDAITLLGDRSPRKEPMGLMWKSKSLTVAIMSFGEQHISPQLPIPKCTISIVHAYARPALREAQYCSLQHRLLGHSNHI